MSDDGVVTSKTTKVDILFTNIWNSLQGTEPN